jgi:hypothetical protein
MENNLKSEQNLRQAGQLTEFDKQLENLRSISEDWVSIVEKEKEEDKEKNERFILEN